jgi:DNA-binding response OmpR family regulator
MAVARPVLVVHHHPLVVEALDMTLAGLGFTVHAAVTYAAALRLLDKLESGLAAVVAHGDMQGEPLDGALLRTVRARHPTAAIVVISARSRCDVGELPDGSVYLPEPFDRADLVAAIISACDPRTARPVPAPIQ